jgi:hypothetical protein
MLSYTSLGHLHKLSHGLAEVRECNFMILTDCLKDSFVIGPTWYAESDKRTYYHRVNSTEVQRPACSIVH